MGAGTVPVLIGKAIDPLHRALGKLTAPVEVLPTCPALTVDQVPAPSVGTGLEHHVRMARKGSHHWLVTVNARLARVVAPPTDPNAVTWYTGSPFPGAGSTQCIETVCVNAPPAS
jgi:hypothetical protein